MQEVQETWVQSLGREYPLEEDTATHSSILTWKIPWTEKPGGLQWVIKSWTRLKQLSKHAHMQEKEYHCLEIMGKKIENCGDVGNFVPWGVWIEE